MIEKNSIEFIVRGSIGDKPISPENISIELLDSFTQDIQSLIKSIPEAKKEDIIVSIEKGSFKIKSVLLLVALNSFVVDIQSLKATKNLNTINDKRSKIFESWLNKTKLTPNLEFEIIPFGYEGIKFNSDSNINRIDSDVWIESEVYLFGIVTDLGGASKPNIHLKTENGSIITIDCEKKDLESETSNRVYKPASIRVIANQNILSGEIKDAKFVSFEEYNETFDEVEFFESIEKGRNAWSDVSDHVEWVRNLRTDYE